MEINSLFQALADPTRRMVIKILQNSDATPGEIGKQFPITKPSLSHHLDILKRAGLVVTQRKGQNIVYSLNVSVFEEVSVTIMDLFKIGKTKERKNDEE
jgi:ArsR family transcriptional regulator, arsenate/arsenite/antimonite-responsive transcriptional repressor